MIVQVIDTPSIVVCEGCFITLETGSCVPNTEPGGLRGKYRAIRRTRAYRLTQRDDHVHNAVSGDRENPVMIPVLVGGSVTGGEQNAFGDFAGTPLV